MQATADVTTRLLVEAHLSLCQKCSAIVAEHQRRGERLPPATLHDELDLPSFGCVWKAIEQAVVSQRCSEAAVLPPALLGALPHSPAWRWIVVAWPAQVRVALVLRDPDTGSELYLCHLAPRSTFPHHRHVGLEENVILAGRYDNGGIRAEIGDWVIGAPGTEERSRTEDRACWCLSRIEPPGVQFTGWRRLAVPFFSR
jgi:anti-sigma factor ChrR (cupin superfamily)